MNRKVILLTSLVVLLSCFSAANAGFELKFDIAINVGDGVPAAYTDKSQDPGFEDWLAWVRYGADKERHDATFQENVEGTGLTVGIGAGDGSSDPGTILDYSSEADDPICNTWIRCNANAGDPNASVHLVLSGVGLVPGTYWVYGYHNSVDGNEPNMPVAYVNTFANEYWWPNFGAPPDADGGGVIQEANDVDIAINHVGDDTLLEANRSLVKFYTDGSPVIISYGAAPGSTGVLNAFIIQQTFATYTAGRPFPKYKEEHACPDTSLTWEAGEHADTHKVYFDPNFTEEKFIFGDNLESGDANWVKSNWTVYDSNVLGDGNSDGNSASAYHSLTPGSGSGTLTTVDINTIEAGTMRVSLSIKHTLGTETDDIRLYYYNGTGYDYIADLNSIGPNDVWATYTDDVNESQYLRTNFKLQLRSSISAGEVYVDNFSVTNTWPIGDEFLVYSGDVNSYTPPGNLDFGKTYYWRVDEVNDACSASPWKGYLWYFTTESGKAYSPDPEDHAGFKPEAGITLGWTSSCLAASGDYLYFGTDFDDVNEGDISVRFGPKFTPSHVTGALAYATKYYWKVNSIGGSKEGDVWSFQTDGYPLMYYEFEGVIDANITDLPDANFITDSTGNVKFRIHHNHSELGESEIRYDVGNPLYNVPGTSAHFIHTEPNDNEDEGVGSYLSRSCFGPDLLDLDGPEYTIEAWVRRDGPAVGVRDGNLPGTIIRKGSGSYGLGIDDDGAVKFMHVGEHISSEMSLSRIGIGEWHHIAAVFDACDSPQNEKLYIDGLVVADNNVVTRNPQDDYGNDVVCIGAYLDQDASAGHIGNYFNGAIDELRVVNQALTANEFLIRGDLGKAWLPRPSHYATEIPYDTGLQWLSGDWADRHDVYFGTSYDDVNDADTTTAVIYKGPQVNNDYDPGDLYLETTYYWRIDEVDDSNGYRWKGNVWRFTTANYIIIDDFESYTCDNDMYTKWIDWYYNGTGSTLLLSASGDPTHTGDKSMLYSYNNFSSPYYSEAERVLSPTKDWPTELRLVQLFFYGKSTNSAGSTEQLHLIFKDSDSNSAGAAYGDQEGESMSDVQVEDWTEWKIPLSTFSDVNLGSVASVFINFGQSGGSTPGGTGLVFFDDIRVAVPICVPSEGPEYDFSGNCIVDIADVGIMGEEWLRADINFSDLGITVTEPSTTNLVGFWKLEGNGNDSSGKGNNGTPEGTYSWVTGYDAVNQAIEFDDGRVLVPDHATLRPESVVSAACWVYYDDDPGDSARVVVKGGNDREAYCLEIGGAYEFTFYVGEPNGTRYFADANEGDVRPGEWLHLGGTYDGTTVKSYVNGMVVGTEANSISLSQDPNGLAIGNRSEADANDRPFTGIVDEVRVYSAALSQAEMAWLATDGEGYVPLQSRVNIYDEESMGQKAVNFRDFALLMTKWLEKKLWPPEP